MDFNKEISIIKVFGFYEHNLMQILDLVSLTYDEQLRLI